MRWRIAGVSAALTFVILVLFAVVVGHLATERLRSNFEDELHNSANEIAAQARVTYEPAFGAHVELPRGPGVMNVAGAEVAFVNARGEAIAPGTEPLLPGLSPQDMDGTRTVGDFEVAATPVLSTFLIGNPIYVEYGRDRSGLDETIGRLWLFLGIGVAGGTILATLAGLAVARRAMRPIAALTGAAREIASTRDPSRRVPHPESDDEVAELARTLDQMLSELDAARNETEQMMQAQREFVADASHELRTPLTSILANLELLQDELERHGTPGEESEIVASALRSSRRMRRLVADLLLLARADAGRESPRLPLDLSEVAAAALDEVRPVANGHGLRLHGEEGVRIEGNPDELHRLALNLIDNGLRHTPPGTRIEVAVERRDGHAVLEVTDDGPGLPEGMESQIFARFVRGDGPADLAADSGAGLGLAIVEAVADSHGGGVQAGASPAGGARFTVTLPLARAAPNI